MTDIVERDDVRCVCFYPQYPGGDGEEGDGYRVARGGVTEIRIVKRHGPMGFIPYVEVWVGDSLLVEAPQHSTCYVEFNL